MGLFKSYYDKLDRITRKKEKIERSLYVRSINYETDPLIQKMVQDVLQTNYLDIIVYKNRIVAGGLGFYFSNYGKNNIELDEARKLAEYIKKRATKFRYSYRVQPVEELIAKGSVGGYYGINHRGSAEWFSGDSSDGFSLIGWRIHNENFDIGRGIYKEWSSELHRYRRWDVKNQRYLD